MLYIIVKYRLKENNAEDFVKEINASGAADKVRMEDGCISYEYFCPGNTPDTVYLLETWESDEQQKIHMEQPHMKTIQEIKDKFCDSVTVQFLPQGKYRHYKGNEYELLYTALHSEEMVPVIVYRALYGSGCIWVRPAYMWDEQVQVNGECLNRFTYVR